MSPKRIIYCEGRDKLKQGGEGGFDAQVFNTIFGHKYHDTQFVSSGGNTELDQRSEIAIAILSKVYSELEIWVLKDRDFASGKDTTQEDRIKYLSLNPDNHRVLKRWEIENYLFDAEVLAAYCGANNLEFDLPTYEKFVTDIVNENVKDQIGGIKSACNIIGTIGAEQFKLRLAEHITDDMAVYQELEEVIFKTEPR